MDVIQGLSNKADVDGHEIGRDEADIFIDTDDPQGIFEEAKPILMSIGHWDGVRAAFREISEDEYTVLWPQTQAGALAQHVPTLFPVNTFSLGAQQGGHILREVEREEQRMRDAFNVWQGKYTTAVGEFAFLLRVDGSMIRYTELFRDLADVDGHAFGRSEFNIFVLTNARVALRFVSGCMRYE